MFCYFQFQIFKFTFAGNFRGGNKYIKIAYNKKAPEVTLRTITVLHFNTVKVTNMIKETFSFQTLIILTVVLVRIIETAHYLLNNKTSTVAITVDLFWVIILVIEAFIMFLIATIVEEMVRHNVLSNKVHIHILYTYTYMYI